MTVRDRRCEDHDAEAEGVRYFRCKETAVVGWGDPPRWICQRHLNLRLKEARALVDRLQQLGGTS